MNLNKVAELAATASPFPLVRGQAATTSEESAVAASPDEAKKPSGERSGGIATRWRELQGEHSWDGLLDPLDIDLRRSIINYGELAEATYDGFNTERRSPHLGACMYSSDELLHVSGVTNPDHYKITKFIYATSTLPLPAAFLLLPLTALKDVWCRESNFIGYVAVATDKGAAALGRRDIVVAWRGTVRPIEWTKDLDVTPAFATPVLGPAAASSHPGAMVHNGFLSLYTSSSAESKFNKTSARDQVVEEVKRLMELHKHEETSITVTGHSLGAALATLNAVDLVAHGVNAAPAGSSKPPCPVTAIVFACPRVGNIFFRTAYRSFRQHLKSLHIMNFGDVVPTVPLISYVDVHVPLSINTDHSPFLSWPLLPPSRHSLELYLHGLAGHQGSRGGFKLEVERDIALVNKGADLLKDEYPVPADWWTAQHKGMVKNAQGKWELRDFKHI